MIRYVRFAERFGFEALDEIRVLDDHGACSVSDCQVASEHDIWVDVLLAAHFGRLALSLGVGSRSSGPFGTEGSWLVSFVGQLMVRERE